MPSSNISGTRDPCGPRSRVSTIRQISTLRRRSGIVSGSRERSSATGMRVEREQPPAGTDARGGRAAVRVDVRDEQLGADQAHVEARVAAEIDGRGAATLSRPDGMSAKCDSPSRPSMSRMTSRSSPSVCARAARGASSALTAGQSTPFIVGSKCESRMMVQAASNVSLPLDACAGGNRGHRADDRERSQSAVTSTIHLMSALICAGTAKTDGSTLPYSTDGDRHDQSACS